MFFADDVSLCDGKCILVAPRLFPLLLRQFSCLNTQWQALLSFNHSALIFIEGNSAGIYHQVPRESPCMARLGEPQHGGLVGI